MMKKILVLVLLSFVQLVYGQSISGPGKSELDKYLSTSIENSHIPGAVALVTSADGIIYQSAFGSMDVAGNRSMTADTIFRIASMTKPVTSVAVMMLVEQGKIKLDDPVAEYLPEFRDKEVFTEFDFETGSYETEPIETEITIRHLLAHTSGLGYIFDSPILAYLVKDFRASTTRYPLLHQPGSKWTYGESTAVLGHLVEKVSGEALFDFMKKNILVPLKMDETFFDVPADRTGRVTTFHSLTGNGMTENPNPAEISSPHKGDGGLYSTVYDYSRFIRMFLNGGELENSGRILTKESIADMGRNHIGDLKVSLMPTTNPSLSKPFPLGAGIDTFGLGFQVTETRQTDMRAPGSMAWAGIFNTEFWIDPENGIGAVLMMQYLPFYDDKAIEVLQGFEKLIYQNLN